MQMGVVSLFPEMIRDAVRWGVGGRALERGIATLACVNPRQYAAGAHQVVDDRPYGGGPGMVLKPEPLTAAVAAARQLVPDGAPVVFLSPQGRVFDQACAMELAQLPGLVLVCGRYEGFDERLVETEADLELSLGDYVLSGGELGALVVMDAVLRLLPGVLGDSESAAQDSFVRDRLDCPHYTRPEEFAGLRVPAVLLSGDHGAIRRWRLQQALGRTWQRRPELLARTALTDEERELLEEYKVLAGKSAAQN
jgi:tRNA (guanine37-N1)-methyltransferase